MAIIAIVELLADVIAASMHNARACDACLASARLGGGVVSAGVTGARLHDTPEALVEGARCRGVRAQAQQSRVTAGDRIVHRIVPRIEPSR